MHDVSRVRSGLPSPLACPERAFDEQPFSADNALVHLTNGAWSSQQVLILDDERHVTAESLKGEHVQEGRAGVSLTLFRSAGTLSPKGGSPSDSSPSHWAPPTPFSTLLPQVSSRTQACFCSGLLKGLPWLSTPHGKKVKAHADLPSPGP